MVLIGVVVSRGQRVAIGLVQAERRAGGDLREGPRTVCGEVEGGLPGLAPVAGPLDDKLAGTGALRQNNASKVQRLKRLTTDAGAEGRACSP